MLTALFIDKEAIDHVGQEISNFRGKFAQSPDALTLFNVLII